MLRSFLANAGLAQNKRSGLDAHSSTWSPRNLLSVCTVCANLFFDASLRDQDSSNDMANNLLVSFVASMYTCLSNGIKDKGSMKMICSSWHVLVAISRLSSDSFRESVRKVMEMDFLKSDASKVCAWISVLLLEGQLHNYLAELYSFGSKLEQVYEPNAFLLSDEMRILIETVKPFAALNINISITTVDMDSDSFHEVDVGFLFKSAIKVASCFPFSQKDTFEGGSSSNFLISMSSADLISQNSYLEDQCKSTLTKLADAEERCKDHSSKLKETEIKLVSAENKITSLTNENIELRMKISESVESTNVYSEQANKLKQIARDLKAENCELLNSVNDQKNLCLSAISNVEILRSDVIRLEAELHSSLDSKKRLECTVAEYKRSDEENTKTFENYSRELELKQLTEKELKSEITKLSDHIANMKRNAIMHRQEISMLKKELEDTRSKFEGLETALEEMGTKFSRTTLKMDDFKEGTEKSKVWCWRNDCEAKNCQGCNSLFTYSLRRHHCRKCGGVFCFSCSEGRIEIIPGGTKQRVCNQCLTIILNMSSE